MWFLKKLNEDLEKYLISEKGSYSIGRKNCDIILDEDASISRKHCTLNVAKKSSCKLVVSTLTGAWLVDEKSKYGTYLKNNNEWVKVNPSEEIKLTSGNVIKFGLLENIWSLEYKPVIACASALSVEQKKEIEGALIQIDGELRNAWSNDCSLVIVNEITLTVKVVLALINGVPIVNINYVKKLVECVKNQTSLPDSKKYRPEMKESILDSSLVSLDPNDTRKDLFKGQIFVFPTKKQLETLKCVVLSAGGKVDLLSLSDSWDKFGEKNVVMIQLPLIKSSISNEVINKFQELATFLKSRHMKRVVPESEIAQAIAYASTEKYCNPNAERLQVKISSQKPEPDLGDVLVEETQEFFKKNISEPCIVPCSPTSESFLKENDSQLPTSTRKRNHSPDQLSPKAKIAKGKIKDTTKTTDRKKTDKFLAVEKESTCKRTRESSQVAGTSSKRTKNSLMTDYFNNKNKDESESLSQHRLASQIGINTSSYWAATPTNNQNKRRLSPEKGSDDEDLPQPKKSKQPPETAADERKNTAAKEKKSASSPVGAPLEKDTFQKRISVVTNKKNSTSEKDFTSDFIEREDNSFRSSSDHDKTVYSLSIISSTYLNADGTLIDPPETPVNVKKFKKQKIFTLTDLAAMESLEKEPEVGNWLVPHAFN